LDIGFTEHFTTRLGTTSNYSAIANLHTSQITTPHNTSFPACVCSRRSLVTAFNSGDSSPSELDSSLKGSSCPTLFSTVLFLHSLPYRTDFVAPTAFLIISRHGQRRQHRPFIMLTVSAGMCLPSRSLAAAVYYCLIRICCLATNVVPLSVSRPLPRNECSIRAVR
jgi:hypothetical protein